MKKLLYKIWDNRELLLAIIIVWIILLSAMFWILPTLASAYVKTAIYSGIELGERLQTEDIQPANASLQQTVNPYDIQVTNLEVR